MFGVLSGRGVGLLSQHIIQEKLHVSLAAPKSPSNVLQNPSSHFMLHVLVQLVLEYFAGYIPLNPEPNISSLYSSFKPFMVISQNEGTPI